MSHATGIQFLKQEALPHTWCAGCGIGIMLGSLTRAFEELGYTGTDTVIVTGIGCTGKADDIMATNALHTTHGRALAFATGIKAFNPKLHVVVLMGDGDSVTIGGNHFIHAARRNIDVTAIVINNFNYGMTGGAGLRNDTGRQRHEHHRLWQPGTGFRHLRPGRGSGSELRRAGDTAQRLGPQRADQGGPAQEGLLAGRGVQPLPYAFWEEQPNKAGAGDA
jgi:hypothetical protein